MDIVSLLEAERDKLTRQLNGLDTAIEALSGLNSTRVSRGSRRMSKNLGIPESTMGEAEGTEGCPDQSWQASHFSSRSGANQSGN